MKSRIALLLVTVVCGLWVIFPDPVPLLIDDIAAAFIGAGSLLKLIKSFVGKELA